MNFSRLLLIISIFGGVTIKSSCQKSFVLDSTFGEDGVFLIEPNNPDLDDFDGPYLFEIDEQKNIHAILQILSSQSKGMLFKLNGLGSYNNSFGTNGIEGFGLPGLHNLVYNCLRLRDGGFIVSFVASNQDFTVEDLYLQKFNSSGNVDVSFGDNGLLKLGNYLDFTIGGLVEVDDGIVGFFRLDEEFDLIKFDHKGKIDESFGENGKTTFIPITQFPELGVIIELGQPIIYHDEHIYMFNFAGPLDDGTSFIEIHKFDKTGRLDTDWEELPATKIAQKKRGLYCRTFKVDKKGDLIAAYFSETQEEKQVNFLKISTDGLIDSNFKLNGVLEFLSTPQNQESSYNLSDIRFDAENNYLFSVYSTRDDFAKCLIYKYTEDGDRINTFGEGGELELNISTMKDENHWGFNTDHEGSFYIATNRRFANGEAGDFVIRKYKAGTTMATNSGIHREQAVKICPNPARDYVSVFLAQPGLENHVCLLNLNGTILYHKVFTNKDIINIPINKYPAGCYIITTTNEQTKSMNKIQIIR